MNLLVQTLTILVTLPSPLQVLGYKLTLDYLDLVLDFIIFIGKKTKKLHILSILIKIILNPLARCEGICYICQKLKK
jgi:hypothetical protein